MPSYTSWLNLLFLDISLSFNNFSFNFLISVFIFFLSLIFYSFLLPSGTALHFHLELRSLKHVFVVQCKESPIKYMGILM